MDRFEYTVDVRYNDLDTYGHVNNAVYGTYCEEARIAYIAEVLGITEIGEFPAVVASLNIDFRSSVTQPTSVDVRVWVPELGNSSLTMAYELEQDGRVVAEAETTIVAIDPATRETRALPEEWREAVVEYEDLDD